MDANTTEVHQPRWLIVLKGMIRPFLTIMFSILYVYIFIHNENYDGIWISSLNSVILLILGFWFGERVLRNIGITNLLSNFANYKKKDKLPNNIGTKDI